MKSYRLLIRTVTESDLAAAYRSYEDRDAGLDEEFLRAVEATLLGVQKKPANPSKNLLRSPQIAYEEISLWDILPHRKRHGFRPWRFACETRSGCDQGSFHNPMGQILGQLAHYRGMSSFLSFSFSGQEEQLREELSGHPFPLGSGR